MQIFFLPEGLAIALCFVLWPIFQLSAAYLVMKLPDKYFTQDVFLFRTYRCENHGKIYDRVFRVRRWKRFLPDGGAIGKKGYKKKSLDSFSEENLNKFLMESCRAEMAHIVAIFPFWVFGFFAPSRVILMMFFYSLAVNLPCIIAQRYNRPRIAGLLVKKYR